MADKKKVVKFVKLNLVAGRAAAGPALGQAGINMQEFIQKFNDQTSDRMGAKTPTKIYVYEDKSFTFKTTLEPAADMLLAAANIKKGSGVPNKQKVATISQAQVREIAEKKLPDLNTNNVDAAAKIIAGTALNMGIVVED